MKTTYLLSAVLLAAACGGGKSNPDANLSHPDARQIPDAMQQGCTLEANIADALDPTPDTGNTAVIRGMDGAAPPNLLFIWNFVVAGTGANPDLFQFVMPRPAVAADLNTPLALIDACTASVDYCMVGLGDIDAQGNEAQFFYPNTGTVTITEAQDAVGGNFTVAMTASRFDHYDAPGGAMSTDGCNGTVAGFAATTISVIDPAFAPQTGPTHSKWGKYLRPDRQ